MLDKLTYAGNLRRTWRRCKATGATSSCSGDIGDRTLVARAAGSSTGRARSLHFAAESHVDRSIHGPGDFIQTNVVGTFRLLEAVRALLERAATRRERDAFRFLHVSTDEVYGSLGPDDPRVHRDARATSRTARTRRARRRAITSCAPGTTPTACRC